MALRVALSWSLLFTAYFLIPIKRPSDESDLPWLILALCAFAAVVALAVPAIIRSPHPAFRAVEALALIIPLYLLIFARIYLSNSLTDPSVFTESLDRSSALYFTVTVFATVGSGSLSWRPGAASRGGTSTITPRPGLSPAPTTELRIGPRPLR